MTIASRPLPAWRPEQQPRGHQDFSWRNYFLHAAEGGFFLGGIAFLAVETVLPTMLGSLGAPEYLIGVAPVLMLLGFNLPALFTAHIAEGRSRMLPFLLVTGIFQRVPFLFGALGLWLFAADYPVAIAYLVALLPLVSGLAGGISGPAWMELTARILPPNKRASSLAIRFLMGSALGIVAGEMVDRILSAHSGPHGYALLHILCFAFLSLSYIVFALQREEADASRLHGRRHGMWSNLRSVPQLMRETPHLKWLMSMSIGGLMMHVTVPFMALHAQAVLQSSDAYAGRLLQAQMIGAVVGNLLGARLGDRFGSLTLVRSAQIGMLLVFILIPIVSTDLLFRAVFCLFGASFTAMQIGTFTTTLAAAPVGRRPTAVALIGAANALGMLLASNVGGQLQAWLPGTEPVIGPAAVISALCVVVALLSSYRLGRGMGQ